MRIYCSGVEGSGLGEVGYGAASMGVGAPTTRVGGVGYETTSIGARMTILQLLEYNLELKDRVYRTVSMGVAGASTTYEHFVTKF